MPQSSPTEPDGSTPTQTLGPPVGRLFYSVNRDEPGGPGHMRIHFVAGHHFNQNLAPNVGDRRYGPAVTAGFVADLRERLQRHDGWQIGWFLWQGVYSGYGEEIAIGVRIQVSHRPRHTRLLV